MEPAMDLTALNVPTTPSELRQMWRSIRGQKLPRWVVKEIRDRRAAGESLRKIAKAVHVSLPTVQKYAAASTSRINGS